MLRDRKNKKIKIKSNSGMVMFEFMLVVFMSMLFVGALIEMGFYLKSEAIIVGYTKELVRDVQVKGGLTQDTASRLIDKLEQTGIKDVKVKINVYRYDNPDRIDTNKSKEFTSSSNEKVDIGFRQNFKLYITGNHSLRLLTATDQALDVPAIFAVEGKGENASSILNNP